MILLYTYFFNLFFIIDRCQGRWPLGSSAKIMKLSLMFMSVFSPYATPFLPGRKSKVIFLNTV